MPQRLQTTNCGRLLFGSEPISFVRAMTKGRWLAAASIILALVLLGRYWLEQRSACPAGEMRVTGLETLEASDASRIEREIERCVLPSGSE